MNSKWKTALIWLLGLAIVVLIIGVGMRDSIYQKINGEKTSWPSILTSKELVKSNIANTYYLKKKLKTLKGETDFVETPNTIRYVISTDYDYIVDEGELSYRSKWSIKPKGLAFGVNYLTISFDFSDGEDSQDYKYIIYNYNEKNADALAMKTLDGDADGLTDYYELTNSETNPNSSDTDGNGTNDGAEDPDNDGLDNLKEQELGSLANAMDSDSDGLTDSEEIAYNTDLLVADTDKDSFSDHQEIQMGTDPNNRKDPKSTDDITYDETADFNSGMSIDISMKTKPNSIGSFEIYEIPKSFAISSKNIEGMIGTGISIVMDGEPTEAEIRITLECEDYIEGENYYLYYYNEETYKPEYVTEQSQEGNVITAKLYHFSKYFVSSVSEEEAMQGAYADYGIDLVSTESTEALFESYEDYIAKMYPDQAVFSINICAANIDKAVAYVNGNTGHTWISYYYAGDDDELEIRNLDANLSAEDVFGAIGFGGWVNQPDDVLFSSWDGSMKFPSGYRELYFDGKTNEDNVIIYQSQTLPYSEDTVPSPEDMDAAFISMPFVIDAQELSNLIEFVNSYNSYFPHLNKLSSLVFW